MDAELQEFPALDMSDRFVRMAIRLPVVFDWVEYKGEVVFTGINYDATRKAGKPMMNIYYCATEACNDNVLKTVQWDKNKFKPSSLGLGYNNF